MPIIGTIAGASARGYGGMRNFGGAWNTAINYLVVAGGAGGGWDTGGGGGAGGFRSTVTATGGGGSLETPLSLALNTSYTVTVGGGGAGSTTAANKGVNGSDSIFATITSTGGGGGGSDTNASGANGGSGGGEVNANRGGVGGTGTPNQGFDGGSASGLNFNGSGGGGAGAIGGGGLVNAGGAGGAGVATSITGSSVTYAGGGGGGSSSTTGGAGGTGGGGAGGLTTPGTSGTQNTGGGGGGGGASGTNPDRNGGAGGSGIVIARYSGSQAAYGGTVTSSGGNTIHTFNSSSVFYTGLTLPVTGASLWLDASDSANVTLSGSNVTTWSDKSGNSNHFTAPSGKEPLYVTNSQNGLPGIKFFPSSSIKCLTNTSLGNWSESVFTAFFVFNSTTSSGNFPSLLGRNSMGAFQVGGNNSAPSVMAISKIGSATQSTSLSYTGTTADVGVYKATAASTTSVTVQAYKNGTAASATVTQGSLTSTGDKNTIGANVVDSTPGDTMAPNAYLCEIILYPSSLSDADRNKVEGYLKAKWGTP